MVFKAVFIDNDYERRWVNGTIGMVSGIDENGNVYVLLESGVEHLVEPTSWRNYKYKYNEKEKRIEEEIVGTFEQLPIRLAWPPRPWSSPACSSWWPTMC